MYSAKADSVYSSAAKDTRSKLRGHLHERQRKPPVSYKPSHLAQSMELECIGTRCEENYTTSDVPWVASLNRSTATLSLL